MALIHKKAFIGVLFTVFLMVSSFGVVKTDMVMGMDGQMSSGNCFMPGMTVTLCQMNPLEHIASWQSMFTAIPNQSDILVLLLTLLALVLGALIAHSHRSTAPPRILIAQPSFAYYKRHIPVVHPLQEAFSNGILHPKLF